MPSPLPQTTPRRGPWASRLHAIRLVAETPLFLPLFVASVLVGFRDSMSLPYTALFAVERAHMGPLAVGIFLTVKAGGAIAMSMLFGAWFDRRPSLWPLMLTFAAGAVGYALLTTTTDYMALCLIAAVPLGIGAAAFPLVFAVARAQAAKVHSLTASRSVTLLRASFSLAWGIGPALGAVVVGDNNYSALFWVSAVSSGLAIAPLARARFVAPESGVAARAAPSLAGALVYASASLTAFSMAIGMGAVALPIAVVADFGGSKTDVGIASSLCALLETPVMMAIAARPAYFLGYRGMAMGFVATVLYFVAAAVATSAGALIWVQILRAVGIGFVSCIGISYLQDLSPNRIGAASALYANTSQVGQLLAGLTAGVWAQAFDYRSLFWPCAVASAVGLVLLTAGRREEKARAH